MPRRTPPPSGLAAHVHWIVPLVAFVVILGGGVLYLRHSLPPPEIRHAPALVPRPASPVTQPPLRPDARRVETAHYVLYSTATPEQTRQVAQAVEHLHAAYRGLFPIDAEQARGLELVLYRDRDEFRRHAGSRSPWAEAYYLSPRSHAYVAEGANPYHWMLHEATHQLMRQASGYGRRRWVDEGIAAYFGSSLVDAGGLHPGRVDASAYPAWWLREYRLAGRLATDVERGTVIPLRALLTDTGPDFDAAFNRYYVQYWSLVHFLMHGEGGRHASAVPDLVARGGTLPEFERLVGPVDAIEARWYAHFAAQVRDAREGRLHGRILPNG